MRCVEKRLTLADDGKHQPRNPNQRRVGSSQESILLEINTWLRFFKLGVPGLLIVYESQTGIPLIKPGPWSEIPTDKLSQST